MLDWEEEFAEKRRRMVEEQIRRRGVTDPRVLAAMERVPRHLFIPEEYLDLAYDDRPLPIGKDQTISQPYIVAYMTQALELTPTDHVLEVGLGSGYQAVVLAQLAAEVYSIEIVPELVNRTRRLLAELGYTNVHIRIGDGHEGWPEAAPFEGIIATAAPDEVPRVLLDQLAPGGRMVIPIGSYTQELKRIRRSPEGDRYEAESLMGVRFVPMTGSKPVDGPSGSPSQTV